MHLLNAHAQPIFTLRVFYDHLLTVREKKNSFHFDKCSKVISLVPFIQIYLEMTHNKLLRVISRL